MTPGAKVPSTSALIVSYTDDVDALEHRGEDVRLDLGARRQVLVGVDADGPHLAGLAGLGSGLEHAVAGLAGGVVDDVSAVGVHRGGDLLALGGVGEAGEVRRLRHVRREDLDVGVDGLRTSDVAGLELLDEVELDATDEADLAGRCW